MEKLLLDTSFLVALNDTRDTLYPVALSIYERISEESEILIPDAVINEAINVFARRCRERKQHQAFQTLMDEMLGFVEASDILWAYEHLGEHFHAVMDEVRRWKGKLNVHDVLLVRIAREQGLTHLVSFDRDFDEMPELTRIKEPDDVLR